MAPRYWLLKTESETFSLDDLLRAPARASGWDEVRNSVPELGGAKE